MSRNQEITKGRQRKQRVDVARAEHQLTVEPVVAPIPWLKMDTLGLRQTIDRHGKARVIFELLQNAWDEDATEVALTLTRPVDGKSTLKCVDNSPSGYKDLSTAHTMFARSYKKSDPTKRGRFNVGEKYVLALCEVAQVTSTTGRTIFGRDKDGNESRTSSTVKTKVGTEFRGELELTMEEWEDVGVKVKMLFPPITTTYNGVEIAHRTPIRTFRTSMLTEVADEAGVTRRKQRETEVRIYTVLEGEVSSLYEQGMRVVEIETKYHVDIQQKVPLNIERDNVHPTYLTALRVAVVNNMTDEITEADSTATWMNDALESVNITPEAVKVVVAQRFGQDAVIYDPTDLGANKEATSQDVTVVPRGSFSGPAWKNVRGSGALIPAGRDQRFTTEVTEAEADPVDRKDYDTDQTLFVRLIEAVSPILIGRTVTVSIINEEDSEFKGCTKRWKPDTYEFEINLAYHNCSNWNENYGLLIHELAHHKVQSNNHLIDVFYNTVTDLGAKLTQLALDQPKLFEHAPVKVLEVVAA
jgi:hypothetical protein